MIRTRRHLAVAMACVAALVTAACSGPATETSTGPSGPTGPPVRGGTARLLMINEPRSLDPAALSNVWAYEAALGNALYGTLMTNDVRTGEIGYKMAESFTTDDDGKSFVLKLREGLTFSDGESLDAAAVKFNWDRIRDPATASSSLRYAAQIASTEVVDATTLRIRLRAQVPSYAQNVVVGAMNWIASPAALKQGRRAFDARPIGAGPFVLESWSRQDKIELERNPRYWDAPKPYLDGITVRSTADTMQRLSTLLSGDVDVVVDTSWKSIAKAREAGFATDVVEMSGGQALFMNTRRPPFDDIRARRAVSAAMDVDATNLSQYNGHGEVPRRLFAESSPFYSDVELRKHDKALAQKLFDELAAEGEPVSFTFTAQNSTESLGVAESVQAQLGAFENVDVEIRTIASAETAKVYGSHDFEMLISSTLMVDPEPQLWAGYHGRSRSNMSGVDDPQLNAALEKGRTSSSLEERKAAYKVVQERVAALVPAIYYTRAAPAVETAANVHGAEQYGFGSLLPEELWMER
ncbi:ABC transporter substrate-binding protein [Actinomadura sp. WMMB 499]|uniref:ABC transporter substrate-binding protein n=1 Tax=Actinomadura sp. WMMB 499 TaxID=1219491 RepID=UPI001245DB5C|nr:ABC transporter substrate-binding protein [Actinomadura sp. WMMB 499]QFG20188.1 ABC transporter substrate-binding protein [Actinomadura sp. WMMB 499]